MNVKITTLKLALVAIGTAIAAFGLDMAIYAGFGSATLAVLWQGVSNVANISIGLSALLIALAIITFCLFYDRHQIHIGTIVYQLIYSFCLDFFAPYMRYTASPYINFFIMIIGLVIFTFGAALYSSADFGRGPYEALTFAIVHRKAWQIRNVRIALDIACVALGMMLGGKAGFCTVATILLSGVFLQFFVHRLKPLVNRIIK